MYESLEFNFLFLFLSIVLAILLGVYIYVSCIQPYSVLKKWGIPGPRPIPFIGNFYSFDQILVSNIELKLVKKYGKVLGIYEGRKPVVLVADLDLLKQILIKDFHHFTDRRSFELLGDFVEGNVSDLKGKEWKDLRNVITPAFSTGKMKNVFPILNDCSDILMEEFTNLSEQNKVIDLKTYLNSFVLDVIIKAAFGIELNSIKDTKNPFIYHTNQISNGRFGMLLFGLEALMPALVPLMKLLGISIIPQKTQDFFTVNMKHVIQMRKQQSGEEKDLLQILLNTQKNKPIVLQNGNTDALSEKKHLTDEEILPQSIMFLIAGSETTSTTLNFCCYLLGKHPEWQDKIAEEIEQKLKDQDSIHYEDISKLQIIDMVVMETLRLYSPGARTERICTIDYEINGMKIPRGTIVAIPIHAIHHDKDVWPNPEKFDPERFSPSNSVGRHPMSFLAFGSGPRNCIGMRFALLEAKLLLAKLIKNFKIILNSDEKIQLTLSSFGLTAAKNRICIRLEKRT